MKRLLILALLLAAAGCMPPPPNVDEAPPVKQIDVYYDKLPVVEYTEVGKVFTNYREYGVFTKAVTPELLVGRLQDEARKRDADGILNIQIDNEPIAGQQNKLWKASATAIKYR